MKNWILRRFGFFTRKELVKKILEKKDIAFAADGEEDVVYHLTTVFDPDYEKPTERKFGLGHLGKWEAMVRKHYEIGEDL